jgi:hypothetical protein
MILLCRLRPVDMAGGINPFSKGLIDDGNA